MVGMGLWQPQLNLKLTVKVVLLGFQDHENLAVDSTALAKTLENVLPSYSAPVVAIARQTSQGPLKVKYDISYEVKRASEDSHREYISALAGAAMVDTISVTDKHPLIDIDTVSGKVEELAIKESGMSTARDMFGDTEVTILVASPNRGELHAQLVKRLGKSSLENTGDTSVTYSFAEAGSLHKVERKSTAGEHEGGGTGGRGRRSTCARSWIGQGRVLVLDLGAAACEYGASREAGRYNTVTEEVFPSVDAGRAAGGASEHWLFRHRQSKHSRTPADGEYIVWSPDHWFLDVVTGGCLHMVDGVVVEDDSPRARGVVKGPDLGAGGFWSASPHLCRYSLTHFLAAGGANVNFAPDLATLFYLKLSSLVVSATRTILAPAVSASPGPGDDSPVIMVPVLVFRGQNNVDNVRAAHGGATASGVVNNLESIVDIAKVSKAVSSMALPNQEIVVVGAVHALSEHPQVAVALRKSLATKTRMHPREGLSNSPSRFEMVQEGYVDSARLLLEMKSAGDELASSLLSDLGTPDWNLRVRLDVDVAVAAKGNRRGQRVRVLPVFVFCLEDVDKPSGGGDGRVDEDSNRAHGKDRAARLFEDSSPFSAEIGGDTVLVLQSEGSAPVPFFEREETLRLPLTDSTQAVVAGLLRSLHGTTPPDHWWPPGQQVPAADLSWAHGFHPFPPFGFGGSTPGELLADIAARNAVVSRAAATAETLSAAASALEDFAQAAVPIELVSGRGAIHGEWGEALKVVSEAVGLPRHVLSPVIHAHGAVHAAMVEYEEALKASPGADLKAALERMEGLRDRASKLLRKAKLAAAHGEKDLQWCQCTTERVSSAHLPWILYLGVLLILCYGLARLVASARRALLQYASSAGPGRAYSTRT